MEEIKSDLKNKTISTEFINRLEKHIRFEERELFPHIEEQLSVEQLNSVLAQLDHDHACSAEWKEEFWNKK